jgi:DNA-binding PadR family transcriptional regulator
MVNGSGQPAPWAASCSVSSSVKIRERTMNRSSSTVPLARGWHSAGRPWPPYIGEVPPDHRDLSLAEWTVLAVVDEEPAHGFAIASLTAADAALGRVWQIPRPVVYRAIGRLEELGLVVPVGVQPGRGPLRQMFAATGEGTAEVARWLVTPVLHVRDARSQLLMKLALLDRRGVDPAELLERQRALLEPIVVALMEQPQATGFDATLAAWRRSTATATFAFLDEISSD